MWWREVGDGKAEIEAEAAAESEANCAAGDAIQLPLLQPRKGLRSENGS